MTENFISIKVLDVLAHGVYDSTVKNLNCRSISSNGENRNCKTCNLYGFCGSTSIGKSHYDWKNKYLGNFEYIECSSREQTENLVVNAKYYNKKLEIPNVQEEINGSN